MLFSCYVHVSYSLYVQLVTSMMVYIRSTYAGALLGLASVVLLLVRLIAVGMIVHDTQRRYGTVAARIV